MKHWIQAALAAAVIGAAVPAQAETISVTLQLPETHYLAKNWEDFGKIISEKSGGDLNIQLFPSAQLFKDNQVPEAVGSGAITAGSASLSRYAGAVPAVTVVSVPFLLDTEEKLRAAVAPGSDLRKLLDGSILKETNNRVLWWQAYGRNIFVSNGGGLTTPDAFKGKKIRSYGTVQGWTAEALGGAPTLISGSEQFLAYQQGTVDIGMTGTSGVEERRLYEAMDTLTLTNDGVIEFIAVINNDFFEGLSEENQKIVLDAAAEVEASLRDFVIADEDAAVARLREKMTVVELTDDQRDAFREATKGVIDRFLESAGDAGQAALDAVNKL